MEPQFIEILVDTGEIIRVVYEISLGDLVVGSMLALLLIHFILHSVIRMVWRR